MEDSSNKAYRAGVLKTMRGDLPRESALANWALGLAGESGEVADLIKKIVFHNKPEDRDKLIKELGDVRWYLEALCIQLGLSIETVQEENLNKLQARYPAGYSHKDAAERKDEK